MTFAESYNYTEPLFVFVVLVVAASRPVMMTVMRLVRLAAGVMPVPTPLATAWLGLAAVPLLGSPVTEPAAATIAALMLAPQIFRPDVRERVKHTAIGVRFVNVSIGGTMTSYAAPPRTVVVVHLALLAGIVLLAYHPVAFLGLFLMFLGCAQAYGRVQSPLIIKEALLV